MTGRPGASVTWRLHVSSTSVDAAGKIAGRVAAATGADLVTVSCELYWKDPTCHVVVLRLAIGDVTPAEGVNRTLELAGSLRADWSLTVPRVEADGSWEVEVVASAEPSGGGFRVPGVRWASVSGEGPGTCAATDRLAPEARPAVRGV